MNWDKEVTLTLTVQDLYYLQHCANSVIVMDEISDFVVGYQPLNDVQYTGVLAAMTKTVQVLKENR